MKKSYNLALSGSGMNLFVHGGAVNALLEAGFTFPRATGTSGGGVIAGAVACGIVGAALEDLLLSFSPIAVKLFDPGLKFQNPFSSHGLRSPFSLGGGLVKGEKMARAIDAALRKTLGKKDPVLFRDTKIPLAVHVTNLTKARGEVYGTHETPDLPIAPYVVHGCRIPGAFKHGVVKGDIIYDGGLWENFPIGYFGNKGEDTLGLFFPTEPLPPGKDLDELSEASRCIDMLIWAKSADDVSENPKAVIIDLPSGPGMDFNMSADEGRLLIKLGRDRIRAWLKAQH